MSDISATPDWAVKAADAVIDDMADRSGWGDLFANLDPEIQDEIRLTWANLIAEAANGKA
jgi:hypothetical protein